MTGQVFATNSRGQATRLATLSIVADDPADPFTVYEVKAQPTGGNPGAWPRFQRAFSLDNARGYLELWAERYARHQGYDAYKVVWDE